MITINKINSAIITSLLFFFTYSFSFSQKEKDPFSTINNSLGSITTLIEVIIFIIITLSFLFFFWNLTVFIRESKAAKLEEAKQRMGWGAVAIFVMVSIWGIVVFIGNVLGIKSNQKAPVITLPHLQPSKPDTPTPTKKDPPVESPLKTPEAKCNDATENKYRDYCKFKFYQECISNGGGSASCKTQTQEAQCNNITENKHQTDCKDKTYRECILNGGGSNSCKGKTMTAAIEIKGQVHVNDKIL